MEKRTLYGSTAIDTIRRIRALDPDAVTGYPFDSTDVVAKIIKNPDDYEEIDVLFPHHSIVTPENVLKMHLTGRKVIAWTVNNPDVIHRCVEAGVDGIVTDYPDYL